LASRAALDFLFPESTIFYENKKPLLTDGSHLSFSHNAHYAVCARSLHAPIGIDLEGARPELLTKIQHKFLHEEEQKLVTSPRDLQIIWGAKEALYKFFGHGGVDFKDHLRITSKPPEGVDGYFFGEIKGIASHQLQLYFKLWGNQTLVVAHVSNI
jgi:phosphopantetheinyl transferase